MSTSSSKTHILIAVLVGTLAYLGASFLGYTVKVEYNDESCQLIPNISPGSEDIAVVDNTLALVSAGDLDRIHFQSKNPARKGAIFALWFGGEEGGELGWYAEKIEIQNYPAGRSFNPHGIHYSNSTERLYAVVHDCKSGGGQVQEEGIDIFRLVRSRTGAGSTIDRKVRLVFERTIESPAFPYGTMNDVVEGASLGEMYVTQWLARPMSKACGYRSFVDSLETKIDALFRRKTVVHRCTWDSSDPVASTPVSCSIAEDGFFVANGITSDPNKNKIYIVDAAAHELHVYDRHSDDGTLSIRDIVHLPYGADNVEFDSASGKLTLTGSPRLHEVIARLDGDDSVKVSGGMVTVQPLPNGTYVVETVLMHDGSKLSFLSASAFANGKVLLGSPPSDGVLVCDIPEKSLASYIQ